MKYLPLKLGIFVVLLFAVVIAACLLLTPIKIRYYVSKLRNEDISWNETSFGPIPKIVGKPALEIFKRREKCRGYLLEALPEALQDDSRFVAAHVLLTHIFSKRWLVGQTEWNELKATFPRGGSIVIDKTQRKAILRFWNKELRKDAEK